MPLSLTTPIEQQRQPVSDGLTRPLAWRLKRSGLAPVGRWLNILLLWQLLTGVSNVLFDWPLVSAVAHTGGSAALLLCLSWTWFTTRVSTTVTISSTLTRPLT